MCTKLEDILKALLDKKCTNYQVMRHCFTKNKGGVRMATRKSVEDFLAQCEDTIRYAQEQVTMRRQQEHYNMTEYTDALNQLEERGNDLAHLALSCNGQQREQLHRMRLQLQQLQNDLTLDENIITEYK
jgi:hypothetical protein